MKDEKLEFKHHLTKIYLEIARSIVKQPLQDLDIWYKQSDKNIDDQNKFLDIGYGILSISCIYSYLSIESFCNWQLFKASDYVSKVKPDIDRLRNQGRKLETLYGENFEPYEPEDFKKGERSELKEKIKNLCKYFKSKQIHEEDSSLWDDFNQLLKDTRDFFVHPKPFPREFQEYVSEIFNEHKPIIYVRTSEEILKYFYQNRKIKIPSWLQENTLFEFKGIKIIK